MALKKLFKLRSEEQVPFLKIKKQDQVILGKHSLKKQFLKKFQVNQKVKDLLNKNYIRIQQQGNTIKLGVNQKIPQTIEFLCEFFNQLISSSMKGYFFIGLNFPMLTSLTVGNFLNLERLQLINCSITNLQPLTWLDSSSFTSIYLKKNNITSLKPLQKTKFNKFSSIDLSSNFFNDFNPLCRMMTTTYNKSANNKFWIYITQNNRNIGNINFICRMQNIQTSIISQNSLNGSFIKQNKTINAISQLQVIMSLSKHIARINPQ